MGSDYTPTVCVDLDGVLNLYDGWVGPEDMPMPREGAVDFLMDLDMAGYRIVIHTTRDSDLVTEWLKANKMMFGYVTNEKVPALVYLGDRAMLFDGSFDGLMEKISTFKAHWEK